MEWRGEHGVKRVNKNALSTICCSRRVFPSQVLIVFNWHLYILWKVITFILKTASNKDIEVVNLRCGCLTGH